MSIISSSYDFYSSSNLSLIIISFKFYLTSNLYVDLKSNATYNGKNINQHIRLQKLIEESYGFASKQNPI